MCVKKQINRQGRDRIKKTFKMYMRLPSVYRQNYIGENERGLKVFSGILKLPRRVMSSERRNFTLFKDVGSSFLKLIAF